MLDTVRLESPPLSAEMAQALDRTGVQRFAVEAESGRELYRLTTAELEGSFDHRISFSLRGGTRVPDPETGESVVTGEPTLLVEGSIHKAMAGHNIAGGPLDVLAPCRWLIDEMASRLGVELPDVAGWTVRRVDWAEAFDLGSYENVETWFQRMQGVTYPRRQVSKYGFTGLHAPGRMTTVKAYHKGPEFSTHDYARLQRVLGKTPQRSTVKGLQVFANQVLRTEVSVRRRLVEDFGHWPTVGELDRQNAENGYLEAIHDAELSRLLKEGYATMETVRTYQQVAARLQELHTPQQAQALLGTWLQLSLVGESLVKARMSRPTFYRHRRALLLSGCSWHSTDVRLVEPAHLLSFVPLSTDPRCLRSEDPRVTALLDEYRAA